ncbi:MAG: SRPBCC domain-containing protein [Patescibacteria group bacterium]|jgi:uncharacterized protein YndB with AHSA1/START domain
MTNSSQAGSDALIIERTFSAPVEKVWQAWSDPELAKKWWGAKAFTAPSMTIDFRVGGKYLFCMRGKPAPDAPEQDFWSTGTYKEIVPMQKIVCTDSFADAQGNIISGKEYGMENFPLELEATITFESLADGTTKMRLEHAGMPAGTDKELTQVGWNESFDKLAAAIE